MDYSKLKIPRDRFYYIQTLVNQFSNSKEEASKLQALAKLSNLAYDPRNFNFLTELNVIDLFLDQLYDSKIEYKRLACGGICNLCLDQKNKRILENHDGVELLLHCLTIEDEEIVKNTLTSLIFLINEDNFDEICTYELRDYLLELRKSKNPCLSNLSNTFLESFFKE